MGDRLHDRGIVRLIFLLASFLVPIRQLSEDIVMELSSETRKSIRALAFRTVTRRARRNVGARYAFLIDLLSLRHECFRCSSQRLGIEILEITSQGFDHRRIEDVRNIEHHGIGSPALDKGPELTGEILRLLPG